MTIPAFLLADIGGTNARFSLIAAEGGQEIATRIFQVRAHPTLSGALDVFTKEYATKAHIVAAAIAVAGFIMHDTVRATNSDWVCAKADIQKQLGIDDVYLINDFEAVAYALPGLQADEIDVLQKGDFSATHPKAVIGPGTGLGAAALAPIAQGHRAIPTEAGNMHYAPMNARETKIIKYLSRFIGFVRVEDVVSGQGLENLYKANCFMANLEPERLNAADITSRAHQGNQLCLQVIDDFAAIFGSFASSFALAHNALGGLYLTGGVYQKIGDIFPVSRFLERFNTNPKVYHLLEKVPVYSIRTEIPAFKGLRLLLEQNYKAQH